MADDTRESATASQTPPPRDPFPTYQSPFPRLPSTPGEEENPFIQFRRFADQQFSSLFKSLGLDLPRVAESSDSDPWLRSQWEEMCRRRQKMEEGWKEQSEQDREERKAQLIESQDENRNQTTSAGMKMSSRADPALASAARCPALSDLRTELDLYEARAAQSTVRQELKQDVQRHLEASRQSEMVKDIVRKHTARAKVLKEKRENATNGWFTLGYDGRQRVKKQLGYDKEHDLFRQPGKKYNAFLTMGLDPFGNPEHTMPWLLINPYSPLLICNPAQSRMTGAYFVPPRQGPLNIFRPSFICPMPSAEDEDLAKQLPWADAFEDLVNLENNGTMLERNYSTLRTPDDWILGMVTRGSLRGWQVDGAGRITRDPEVGPKHYDEALPKWPCGIAEMKLEDVPNGKSSNVDRHSADEIIDALRMAMQSQDCPAGYVAESDGHVSQSGLQQTSFPATSSDFAATDSFSSTSLEPSWSSWGGDGDSKVSVVSTLTTTERRTMADGSIETKRVLKKKFADGREESNESIERDHTSIPQRSTRGTQTFDRATIAQGFTTPESRPMPYTDVKAGRQSGWFWN